MCVIAVDWSGYPSQAFHVLHTPQVCDGRSILLLDQVVSSFWQQIAQFYKNFLDTLAITIAPNKPDKNYL
ncbi:hypothetical protein JNE23011_11210 [Escherichia coli]